jgi:hypothetical protein
MLDVCLLLDSQMSDCLLNLKGLVFVFVQEWVDVKLFRKIKSIIDLLKSRFLLIKHNTINLEE